MYIYKDFYFTADKVLEELIKTKKNACCIVIFVLNQF